MEIKDKIISPIGYVKTDFDGKFGIPRQSGRSPSTTGEIIFRKEFQSADAFRDIQGFSHLWILFDFSQIESQKFTPLIRPPRLGGNKKVGVFASRSPFRPNGIGLSSVKLLSVNQKDGKVISITVGGVDMLNGTPVYDIKPYLPSADCHPDAIGGYADQFVDYKLKVIFPEDLKNAFTQEKLTALIECLQDDPRPSYQSDEREYGLTYCEKNVRFKVVNDTLTVLSVN